MTRDAAPDSPPRIITIYWTLGDDLTVEHPELEPWEAAAALEEAAAVLREVEADHDAD